MPAPRRRQKPRRVNRFRRASRTGPQPSLNVGDTLGAFTVTEYLGHSALRPDVLKKLSQEHHWYKVRCNCGTEETHSQQQLIDVRRVRSCGSCTSSQKEMFT